MDDGPLRYCSMNTVKLNFACPKNRGGPLKFGLLEESRIYRSHYTSPRIDDSRERTLSLSHMRGEARPG